MLADMNKDKQSNRTFAELLVLGQRTERELVKVDAVKLARAAAWPRRAFDRAIETRSALNNVWLMGVQGR